MECNRDEAIRAREIAEKKFVGNDFTGAVKFALKAKNLYPNLGGIDQLISTLNVYAAAGNLVSAEKDWYAIIGVDASVDEAMLKKQYRKMARLIHPDKNRFFGAEGAFKLISEARDVLLDRKRKLDYDCKRNAASNKRPCKSSTTPAAPAAHSTKSFSFWTLCSHCNMKYEYNLCYLKKTLLCPKCKQPFVATKCESPSVASAAKNSVKKTSSTVPQPPVMFNHRKRNFDRAHGSFRWDTFLSSNDQLASASSFISAEQTATAIYREYAKVTKEKQEREAAKNGKDDVVGGCSFTSNKDQTAKERENSGEDGNYDDARGKHTTETIKDQPLKRRNAREHTGNAGVEGEHTEVEKINYVPGANAGECASNACSEREHTDVDEIKYVPGTTNPATSDVELESVDVMHRQMRSITTKELCHANYQRMLIENGKLIIRKELVHLKQKQSCNDNCVDKEDKIVLQVPGKNANSVDPKLEVPGLGVSSPPCNGDPSTDKNVNNQMSFAVPDADFHDFDSDRTEKDFEQNQVWAIYDEEDGMPRYYVKILKILSLKPFQVRINYLNSKGNSEFSKSLEWKFPKTCGNFKVGGHTTVDKVNIFSHRLNLDNEIIRGSVTIFPKKDEIWALYRNWSSDWNEFTEDDVVYRYDMVEVVDDYDEEQGMINVCSLVKVDGFKTVFHRQEQKDDDVSNKEQPKRMMTITREEMFRFSHRVPSYVLTGEEAHNAPKGYYELDPASTPPELLQVW